MEFNGLICCLCLTAKIMGTKGYPFSCKAMSLSRSLKACNRRAVFTRSCSPRKGVTVRRQQHCSSPGSRGTCPAWRQLFLCEQCRMRLSPTTAYINDLQKRRGAAWFLKSLGRQNLVMGLQGRDCRFLGWWC